MLVVGGSGQLGQSFAPALNHIYGIENVLITDINEKGFCQNYEYLDAMKFEDYSKIAKSFKPSLILHLPALLSDNIISDLRKKTRLSPESE